MFLHCVALEAIDRTASNEKKLICIQALRIVVFIRYIDRHRLTPRIRMRSFAMLNHKNTLARVS